MKTIGLVPVKDWWGRVVVGVLRFSPTDLQGKSLFVVHGFHNDVQGSQALIRVNTSASVSITRILSHCVLERRTGFLRVTMWKVGVHRYGSVSREGFQEPCSPRIEEISSSTRAHLK